MLSILDMRWSLLSPTLSHPRRNMLWVPGLSLTHADPDPRHAAVKLHLQHGYRSGNKIEEATYAVAFHGHAIGAMGYQFVWENTHPDPARDDKTGPYLVTVGPNIFDCDCTAADCRLPICRHRSATCRAIFLGLVEGAVAWSGMPESHPDCVLPVPDECWGVEPEWEESGLWFEDEPGEPTREELDRLAEDLGWKRKEMVA